MPRPNLTRENLLETETKRAILFFTTFGSHQCLRIERRERSSLHPSIPPLCVNGQRTWNRIDNLVSLLLGLFKWEDLLFFLFRGGRGRKGKGEFFIRFKCVSRMIHTLRTWKMKVQVLFALVHRIEFISAIFTIVYFSLSFFPLTSPPYFPLNLHSNFAVKLYITITWKFIFSR